jgi:hypothetical protein
LISFAAGYFWLEETLVVKKATKTIDDHDPEATDERTPLLFSSEESHETLSVDDADTQSTLSNPSEFSAKKKKNVSQSSSPWGIPDRAYPAVLGLGLLALTAIIPAEVYPLLTSLTIENGGLGFTSSQIGLSLSIQAVFTLFVQVVIFPRLVKTLGGALHTLRFGLWVSVVAVTLLPWVPDVLQLPWKNASTLVWGTLVFVLCIQTLGGMCSFTSMFVLVNDSAPTVEQLGAVNGLAQMAACFARTIGPFIGGAVWSLSLVGVGYAGKHIVYALVTVLLFTLYAETHWIQKTLGL